MGAVKCEADDFPQKGVPVSVLVRLFGLRDLVQASTARWVTERELIINFADRSVTLTQLGEPEIARLRGSTRQARATRVWRCSDGRLCLELDGGGTEQWVPDELSLDGAVSLVIDAVATTATSQLNLAA